MLNNKDKDSDKVKANTAIKRTNTIKGIAKGLKAVKAISNTLGTSPTETPDVDTTVSKTYDKDGATTGNNPSDREYRLDENGVGNFVDEKSTPKFKDKNRRKAY